MKKLISTLFLVTCIIVGAKSQNIQDSTLNSDGTVTINIKTSAVCEMCKETLEKAMAYEKGVKNSELNVDTKMLTVTYDAKKTHAAKIKVAVTKAGYDADELHADAKAYERLHSCCKKDSEH